MQYFLKYTPFLLLACLSGLLFSPLSARVLANEDIEVKAYLTNTCSLTTNGSVVVQLKNLSATPVPANSISLTVTLSGAGSGTVLHPVPDVLPGGGMIFVEVTGLAISATGAITCNVNASLPGDPSTANNAFTLYETIQGNNLPPITAYTDHDTICSNQRLILQASQGVSTGGLYWNDFWSGNGCLPFITSQLLNPAPVAPPQGGAYAITTQTGNYLAERMYSDGCKQVAITPLVEVHPIPSVQATVSRSNICPDDTVTLRVTGAGNHDITWFGHQGIPAPGWAIQASVAGGALRDSIWLQQGTQTTGVNDLPSPYAETSPFVRQQYLITAGELAAQGIQPGYFKGLAFNISSLNGIGTIDTLRISMAHTSRNELNMSHFLEKGLFEVWTGTGFTPVTGKNMHRLSGWFFWDGVSNVVVDVQASGVSGSGGSNAGVLADNTPVASTAWAASTTTPAHSLKNISGTGSLRPNIQLVADVLAPGASLSWSLNAPKAATTIATIHHPSVLNLRVTDTTTGCFTKQSIEIALNETRIIATPVASCPGSPAQIILGEGWPGSAWPLSSLYDVPAGGTAIDMANDTLHIPVLSAIDTFYIEAPGACTRQPVIVSPKPVPVLSVSHTGPSAGATDGSITLNITPPGPVYAPFERYYLNHSDYFNNGWGPSKMQKELLDTDFNIPAPNSTDIYLNDKLFLHEFYCKPISIYSSYEYIGVMTLFSAPRISKIAYHNHYWSLPSAADDEVRIDAFSGSSAPFQGFYMNLGGHNVVHTIAYPQPALSVLWNTGDTSTVLNNLGAGTYSVTVTLDSCSTTTSYVLTSSEDSPATLRATASPNPFQTQMNLSVDGIQGAWTATLYAADGRRVLTQSCNGPAATLNLAAQPAGVYLLRVQAEGREASFRVVKQ